MGHDFLTVEESATVGFRKATVTRDEMNQFIISIGAAIEKTGVAGPALTLPRFRERGEKEEMTRTGLFEPVSNHRGAIPLLVG